MDNNTLTVALIFLLIFGALASGGSQPSSPAASPPAGGGDHPPEESGGPSPDEGIPPSSGVSPAERELLARLIRAEAEGEPFVGQVAVGATVMNRVKSLNYPDSISGVIFQIDSGYYQYEAVKNGRIYLPWTTESMEAAEQAIDGEDPSYGAIGFYNPEATTNWWVLSRPVTTVIGNHVFYR